ncbi:MULTISPECIES: alpha/beta fold hydrolase [Streptomyces]|uniref:Alpha/beta hydrolase n=1 Tax=Streptomyces chilikensis TaxID=1194079 RepID=A0ABV3EQG9_9ACTN|nr:alpha/beta hydrolase [Streptomyces sp. MJP52]MDH6228069.1 pimeloyl-ACP methyl ester carboxylesterase [Streptomyces sp. MJP52]
MAYEEYGDGPHAVVALHGWFGSAREWRTLHPHLDGAAFRYVFPDYRGYGARLDEPGEHTLAEAAADVLALADSLGLERFSLVGHSMGGAVMQRVLADAPHRVRAMVGISPVPAGGVPFDDQAWALFSGAADDRANRRVIVDMTTGNRLSGVWLDAVVDRSWRNSTPAAVAGYLRAWARTDFHTEVAGSPVEVKVIVGEHDPALGPDVMEATFRQWYPHCELEVLSNAGHYAIDETPVALATSVERFLANR